MRTKIKITDAENILFHRLLETNTNDLLYEFALNFFHKTVNDIDNQFLVIDSNGEIFDGNDDIEWQDNIKQDFLEFFFEKTRTELMLL